MPADVFALSSWVLTYALHSTVLSCGAWLGARWVRSAAAREWIWKCALFGGLFTATWQASTILQPAGSRWVLLDSASSASAPVQGPSAAELDASSQVVLVDEPVRSVALPPTTGLRSTFLVLLLLLGAGALFRIGRLAGSMLRWRRRLSHRCELSEGRSFVSLQRLLERAGARGSVRLFAAPGLLTPAAFGILRPSIALPERALALPAAEQEAILAHELAHALRRDPLWHVLVGLLEAVFFFQPLHRMARRHLHELIEFQCDDWAMALTRSRLPLARSLTEVADWIVEREEPDLAAGMSAQGSALARRIERILDPERRPRSTRLGLGSALIAFGLLSTAATAVPALSLQPLEDSFEESARMDPLATALSELDLELADLRKELGRTRSHIEKAELPPRFAERMQQLEKRSLELERLRAQLDSLVAARSASSTPTSKTQGD
jgi:beta-lactamase regulating signal transducer with metallopeptidase domain